MIELIIKYVVIVGAFMLGGWLLFSNPWTRARRRRHEVAWAGYADPGPGGLSVFQVECRELVASFAAERGLRLIEDRVEGEETYIVATIEGINATVWLYLDQVDLDTPERSWRWEYWDADRPADTQFWLTQELRALAESSGLTGS